jgi:hypothetical protein
MQARAKRDYAAEYARRAKGRAAAAPIPQPAAQPPAPKLSEKQSHSPANRWQQQFRPVQNTEGELLRIDKRHLHVDERYQRKLWPDRIARMAENWNWIACGVLIVAWRGREKNKYYIMDGQHRWEAAKRLPEVRDLPCLAFGIEHLTDEALGFLAANVERKYPALAEQFHALLLAENPTAKIAAELAEVAERDIRAPSDPNSIACVAELMRCIQLDELALRSCWSALVELCRNHLLSARILRGVFGLERRLPSTTDRDWHARLAAADYPTIIETLRQTAVYWGTAGERACAEAILRVVNKGLRQPLQVDWDTR